MAGKRKKRTADPAPIPVPADLPPLAGLDEEDEYAPGRRPRTWLRTLAPAVVVALAVIVIVAAGLKGAVDGLRDRANTSRQLAEEHYALGLDYLAAGDYELAIAEFEVAQQLAPALPDLANSLQEAKQLAQAQVTPTSETRRDASVALYRQAVQQYEDGNLEQAVSALEELHSLDVNYQRQNVETMLTTAHYQLGLNAVREDRLDAAREHFVAVLAFKGDATLVKNAQDQLNLLDLYMAAMSHWDQDWSAAIQALKGLLALAPDYKDVRVRLHDAYVFWGQQFAEQGDWCRASEEFAAALQVFPLEATADRRDDAAIQCHATAEAPTPAPTSQPTAKATAMATAEPGITPTQVPAGGVPGRGQIAFPSFDASRQRHDIYLLDLATGSRVLLRESASQPSFGPGGKRLAFHNEDPNHLGLTVLNLANNQTTEVTPHVEDSTPTWSPDASQLVFASGKYGDGRWRIYVISPDEVRGEGQQWAFGQMPAWSPDGDEIAYHGCDERGNNCSLWVMGPGGFEQARLTTDASDTAPAWSPDSSKVAFTSSRAGNWELYTVDVGTGQERRLTEHPATEVAPVWSPDGKRLAFLSNREGGWAVFTLDIKSGKVQKVIDVGDPYPDAISQKLAWTP